MIAIKIRPSVVLIHEESALLMKYDYSGTEVWGIPGGGIDEGETLVDTVKRELQEELGIDIDVGELIGVVETPAAGKIKHTLHCIFQGTVTNGTPKIDPEHTSALGAEWIDIAGLKDRILYPPINDIVTSALNGNIIPRYLGLRTRTWF